MLFVIARSESDKAIHDCFASLAKTPVCTCKGFIRR